MAAAAATAAGAGTSIILILAVAFTVAAAHPSDETLLLKKCMEALGRGGASLVTFCASHFLGPKAALLAGCGKRETAAIVLNEAHKRSQLVEDFGKKIVSDDSSLCRKELQDLRSCWVSMHKVVSSVGNIYANVAMKKLSIGVELDRTYEQAAAAKGRCKFSAAGRDIGLWLELQVKVKESLKAEIVALAFENQLYSVLD